MKTKGDWKSRFVLASTNIRWYSNTKAVKYFSCYLLVSLPEKVDYFYETNYYVLFWVHIYSHLQKFFTGKHLCWSLFLIRRWPATFVWRESDTDAFLWVCQTVKNAIFTEHLGLLLLCLRNISVVLKTLILISQSGVSNHLKNS